MSNMNQMNRRVFNKQLIAFSALALTPIESVICSIVNQSVKKNNELNYVQINLFGAPARWGFDLVLKPQPSSKFIHNPIVSTAFTGLEHDDFRKTSFRYKLHEILGHQMPPLWKHELATASNESRSPTELMKNMLTIRGMRMQADGHELNNRRLVAPIPGGHSLTGLLAQRSHKDFPIIQMESDFGLNLNAVGAYSSPKGTPEINLNPLDEYFGSLFGHLQYEDKIFDPSESRHRNEVIDKVISIFSEKDLTKSRRELKQIITRDLKKIGKDYQATVKKYEIIIKKSYFDNSIKGVTDMPIPGFDVNKINNLSDLTFLNDVPEKIYKNLDEGAKVSGPYSSEFGIISNKDLRTIFKHSKYKKMAQQFALTELSLRNDISQNLLLSLNPASNLIYESQITHSDIRVDDKGNISVWKQPSGNNSVRDNYTFDTHQEGAVIDILATTYFYNTMMACLAELCDQLKAHGLFDNTIIQVASEFDRDPRLDLTGSDHGWSGVTTSFFSGMIDKYQNVGNIYTNSNSEKTLHQNNGTWGQAAPVSELKGRTLKYEDVISSLCSIYDVENLSPRSSPILVKEGDKIRPIFSELKNIESEDT